MVIPVMPYRVTAFGLSDIGLVRQNNEDTWAALEKLGFFVLADGMGGHRAGEVASKLAVETMCGAIESAFDGNIEDLSFEEAHGVVQLAIEVTNRAVYETGKECPEYRGMGTTLCCLQFHPKGVIYAHVGDSRIYRLRHNQLEQVTRDHSLIREMVDLGQIHEGHAEEYVYKNIITRAVGTEPEIDPSVHMVDIADNDIYMMCTDGLSDMLSIKEMERILNKDYPLDKASQHLVMNAKERGGYDNVTVVLIRVNKYHEPKGLSR